MAIMIRAVIAYYNEQTHAVSPVSMIETGLPSFHNPVAKFENDFVGIETFVRDMFSDATSRSIGDQESKEAYRQLLKYLKVSSWKKLTQKCGSYQISLNSDGSHVLRRLKFYSDKDRKGFGRDDAFPNQIIDLKEIGALSSSLAKWFAN